VNKLRHTPTGYTCDVANRLVRRDATGGNQQTAV
jgi:hypothetical protein